MRSSLRHPFLGSGRQCRESAAELGHRTLLMAIPHPLNIQLAVVNWLDDRFPFTKAVDEALYQRVPNFANAFYYCFGGMVFILIVFELLTGVFLAFYYVPDASGHPAASYTSVQFIMQSVYLGWL